MLASHGFFATDKELNLLMNKFDKYSDAKITMTDFIE
jgi:Ca2+-binding EF-hand superfamily protein